MIRHAALAVTALLASGAVYAAGQVLYFAPEAESRTEIADLRGALSDYDRRLADARAELSQLQAAVTSPSALLMTGPEADTAPWLQSTVRQAVATEGGAALASQTSSAPLGAQHTKLSLLLRARFEETGLFAFLKEVESATPPFIVERLEVQPANVGGGQPSLDVTATIFVILSNADPE